MLFVAEEMDIEKINSELPDVIRVFGIKRVTKGFNSKAQCTARTYNYLIPTVAFAKHDVEHKLEEFRLEDVVIKEINELMKLYLGTKNYHNFTSKKKPKDPSAKRYLISFELDEPFLCKNVEFVVIKIKGQSFMMHQIRKMIGLLIAVIKNHTTREMIEKAFTEEKVNVPRVPGLGLLLDYVHYDRYNNRYGSDGIHAVLEWNEIDEAVDKFKQNYIYPVIIDTEINEKSMINWLDYMYKHSYDAVEDEKDAEDNGDDDDELDDNEAESVKEIKE